MTKNRILVIYVGLSLVIWGALTLLADRMNVRDLVSNYDFFVGYLADLVLRTLEEPFQLSLFAALLATPLHLMLFRAMTALTKNTRSAYVSFNVEMQTILTSLGFIGTIIGISLAVGGLSEALANRDPTALVGGLSVAFDTTFLGLSGALALMLLKSFVAEPEI